MVKATIVDGQKQCTKCGEWKSLDDFNKGSGVGGRHSYCKDCMSAYRKTRNFPPVMEGTKVCTKCGHSKHVKEFSEHKNSTDGRQSCCKACQTAYQKTRNFPPVMEGMKVCSVCGQNKDVKEFNENKSHPDGRHSLCKACQAVYNKTRNFPPVMEGTKVCSVCGQNKDVKEFSENKNNTDGRQSFCKSCHAAYYKEWQASNPEKVKAKNQRRRARLAGTEDDWYNRDMLATLEAFGTDACPYCGGPLENMHWDHFVPVSAGGPTVIGNMVPVCSSCNLSKHDKLPQDFLPPDVYNYVEAMLGYLEQSQAEIDYQVLEMELFG